MSIELEKHKVGKEPPETTLYRYITGNWINQAVYVIAKLEIPDLLSDGPKSSKYLAGKTGANQEYLYRLLRALASIDVLNEIEKDSFELTPISELLKKDSKHSMRAWAVLSGSNEHYSAWGNLFHSVMTGGTAFQKTFGMKSFDFYSKKEDLAVVFNTAMTELSKIVNEAIVDTYDFSTVSSLIDIGGGQGSLISTILKATPDLRGGIFDLPYLVDNTSEFLQKHSILDRCKVHSGDFFKEVPSGYESHIMKLIIHDWNDEDSIKILANCNKAMEKGGKVLIVDKVIQDGDKSQLAKFGDLNMMVITSGRERTEEEFKFILEKSGFNFSRVIPLKSPLHYDMCIIEGIK